MEDNTIVFCFMTLQSVDVFPLANIIRHSTTLLENHIVAETIAIMGYNPVHSDKYTAHQTQVHVVTL